MSASDKRNSYNVVLLGNTLVSRMRREIRRFDPFSDEAKALKPVVTALDALRRALTEFDGEWKDKGDSETPTLENAQRTVLSAGFHTALNQVGTGDAEGAVFEDEADFVDQSSALGYRGGPFKVPDVMLHLSLFRKTGALRIKGPQETIDIEIVDGDVINAFSNKTPEGMRLGEILVAHGAVEEDVLSEFLARHKGDKGRLGEALTNEELVTQEQLVAALKQQFQQLFARCFRMKYVTVSFRNAGELDAPREVRLDVVSLLMEGTPVTGP